MDEERSTLSLQVEGYPLFLGLPHPVVRRLAVDRRLDDSRQLNHGRCMTVGTMDELVDLLGDEPDGVVEIVETAGPVAD